MSRFLLNRTVQHNVNIVISERAKNVSRILWCADVTITGGLGALWS